jgi:hypothetical protein
MASLLDTHFLTNAPRSASVFASRQAPAQGAVRCNALALAPRCAH